MTNETQAPERVWPCEIWMAERDDHDQGVVSAVLSEHAKIARWGGDKERDREFHRYVDADIHESGEKYFKHQIAAKGDLIERLRMEAEAHAQEARTQRSTVHECYRAVTGGTGELGDWNGAKPVVDAIAAKDARIAELEAKVDHLRGVLGQIDQGCNHYHMTATYSESVLRNALRTARDHARAALSREGE